METQTEAEEEEESEASESEDDEVSFNPKSRINVPQIFKSINLIKNKLMLVSMANPFIAECRKLIKDLPSGFLKREYPNWNENQVINFWWSGDINDIPDKIGFSLADNPYLPPSVAFGI